MARIDITVKASIDEANLLLKLCEEGKQTRQELGKIFREGFENPDPVKANENREAWQRMGQEVLTIEAMERGFKSHA